jgi:hypothetical protein
MSLNIFLSENNLYINYKRLYKLERLKLCALWLHVEMHSVFRTLRTKFSRKSTYTGLTPNIQSVWEMLQNALVICNGTDKMWIANKKQKPNGHYAYRDLRAFDSSATWISHLSRQIQP